MNHTASNLLNSDDFSDEFDDDELIAISELKSGSDSSQKDITEKRKNPSVSAASNSHDASLVLPKTELSQNKKTHNISRNFSCSKSPLSCQSSTDEEVSLTHHALNYLNTHSYLYPTNLPLRDYQVNIVHKALFENVLCALPTGLGKTFIASTVMLNWYRWTKASKVIFMAPTRPLVAQQIEACLGITGIPESDSSVLVSDGPLTPIAREAEWGTKRVFFATPQTVYNDLKSGRLDPKSIVCLVVDEAHRATGNHAYVEVVNYISRFNNSFRVLALTATPSGSIEGVQDIIKNLHISSVEIRTESSIDIQKYVHKRNINKIKVEQSDDQNTILGFLADALSPLLSEVNQAKVYFVNDPKNVTQFGALKALKAYNASDAARSRSPMVFKIRAIMSILIKMGHAIHLLKIHGIRPFYEYIEGLKGEFLGIGTDKNNKKRPGKYISQLIFSESFINCFDTCKRLIYSERSDSNGLYYIGHPKLKELVDIVNDFFTSNMTEPDSRTIIFAEYRESAAEIIRILEFYCPTAKSSLFIGQATNSKVKNNTREAGNREAEPKTFSTTGMRQKEQRRVVEDFKSGKLNTLVATSIGEEGLDIGQVDLIICYDQSKSPIRILQRMGRTGRKRAGDIYMLMTEQEENKIEYAFDGYKYIQKEINKNERFDYATKNKILPVILKPCREELFIDIPKENKKLIDQGRVDRLVEANAKKSSKNHKSFPKKGSKVNNEIPENAVLGFMTAAELSERAINCPDTKLKRVHKEADGLNFGVKKTKPSNDENDDDIVNEFFI